MEWGNPRWGTKAMESRPNIKTMSNKANLFGGMRGIKQTGAQQPNIQPIAQMTKKSIDYKDQL